MKKTIKRKMAACLLTAALLLDTAGTTAQAVSVRKADVSQAREGCVLLGVEGKYERVTKSKILKRINEIRKEACTKHYKNPSTGKKLKESDYVAIKWSSDLEWIAQLRASEATVNEGHERPNGQSCFSITHGGQQSWAENLAWNYSGLMAGIEQWYGEKTDWVKSTGGVTGHYESLINPNYQYVGLGSFQRTTGGWYGVAGEFSSKSGLKETQSTVSGKKIQTMEVLSKKVGSVKLQAPTSLKVKKTKRLSVVRKITFAGIMGGKNVTNGTVLDTIKWSSSKKSVASVNENGVLEAKKAGKTVVTAKLSNGKKLTATVTVTK
jgi:uncharacterized protein YkwD